MCTYFRLVCLLVHYATLIVVFPPDLDMVGWKIALLNIQCRQKTAIAETSSAFQDFPLPSVKATSSTLAVIRSNNERTQELLNAFKNARKKKPQRPLQR